MPIAGPNWTPWDLANLQQQQQGLQPLADYGQTQLAVALADRRARQEQEARQALFDYGIRQQIARSRAENEAKSHEKLLEEARAFGITPKKNETDADLADRLVGTRSELETKTAKDFVAKRKSLMAKSSELGLAIEADRNRQAHEMAVAAVKAQAGLNADQIQQLGNLAKDPQGFQSWLTKLYGQDKKKYAEIVPIYESAFEGAQQKVRTDPTNLLKHQTLISEIQNLNLDYRELIKKNPRLAMIDTGEDLGAITPASSPMDPKAFADRENSQIKTPPPKPGAASGSEPLKLFDRSLPDTFTTPPPLPQGQAPGILTPIVNSFGQNPVANAIKTGKATVQTTIDALNAPFGEAAYNANAFLFGGPENVSPGSKYLNPADQLTPEQQSIMDRVARQIFFSPPPSQPRPPLGMGNLRAAEQADFDRNFMLLPNGKVVRKLPTDVNEIARQQMDDAAKAFNSPSAGGAMFAAPFATPVTIPTETPSVFPYNPYVPLIPYR